MVPCLGAPRGTVGVWRNYGGGVGPGRAGRGRPRCECPGKRRGAREGSEGGEAALGQGVSGGGGLGEGPGWAAAGADAVIWSPQSGRRPARPRQLSWRPSSVIPSWPIAPDSDKEAFSSISEI